jgi:hypothetical protein
MVFFAIEWDNDGHDREKGVATGELLQDLLQNVA